MLVAVTTVWGKHSPKPNGFAVVADQWFVAGK
jgi:hypothetical protein